MNTELSISDRIKPKLIRYLNKKYYVDSVADPRYFYKDTNRNISHAEIIKQIHDKTGYGKLDIILLMEKWLLNEGKIKK